LKKRGTLYLWGPSNTGKTTMIVEPLINYFGKENIGLLSNNKNFEYQHINDKKILVFDEFDGNKTNLENLKKLLSGELLLSEKKNKDPLLVEHTPLIISSNYNPESNFNLKDNVPILNRIKSIHFKNVINEINQEQNIKEDILKEEAKIIIYCNRIYFNWIKNEPNYKSLNKFKLL